MRTGIRIACDVGSSRIGLARSDPGGLLAVPLDAIPAGEDAVDRVAAVVHEWDALEVYVGLPLHLSGEESPSSTMARAWGRSLAERSGVTVRLIDERLSTVQAQRALQASGRTTRESRSLVDSASAVMVLQAALDGERATGTPPGHGIDGSGA